MFRFFVGGMCLFVGLFFVSFVLYVLFVCFLRVVAFVFFGVYVCSVLSFFAEVHHSCGRSACGDTQ